LSVKTEEEKKLVQVITKDVVGELKSAIGESKVSDDKYTRIAYRLSHAVETVMFAPEKFTPGAVVWPESVEDVQKVLKIANDWEVPILPVGGRTCSADSEGIKGSIIIDLARMNKVIEFSEAKQRFTAEAGMRVSDCTKYMADRGYMLLEVPTMAKIATLAARAAVHGYNKFENRWGSSASYIRGLEVVLPDGDVVQLGRGTSAPTKSVVGYNLIDLFIGSRGTLGVVTKVTEKIIKTPPAYHYGIRAFKNYRDGVEAYIDLRRAGAHVGPIWRAKCYHKWLLKQAVNGIMGLEWPEDVEMVTDYHILGEKDVVEATEKYAVDILKAHSGFWRDDMPPTDFVGRMHETAEKYMGMGALATDRNRNGGLGHRIVPYDANVPDGYLVEYFGEMLEHWRRMEDPKFYPNLSQRMRVISPGAPVPADEGFTKFWALAQASYIPLWTEEARQEYYDWFRKYAELTWKYEGSISATHGHIPRAIEIEILKKELGENYYKLMEQVKNLIDPKHILNPQTKFRF
jgi:FAD/FMN-containing dehydrogenase